MNPNSRMNPNAPSPCESQVWLRTGAGVCLYFAFMALDTLELPSRTGVASVLGKAHEGPGTSYQTLNLGGRTFLRPYQTPERFVLKLRLDQQETAAAVGKDLYEALNPDSEMGVTYQRCRITGAVRVVRVSTTAGKGGR